MTDEPQYENHEAHAAVMAAAIVEPDQDGGAVALVPADSAIPDLLVRVNPGVTMTHEGEPRGEGDEFVAPGPSAHHLADRGFVTILGEA